MKMRLALLPLTTVALGATLALTGCKHDDGQAAGTTTVRSGTPEGVRVTNTPPPAPTMSPTEQAAARLTETLCAHERECATTTRGHLSSEGALLEESVCVAELKPGARRSIEAWSCSVEVARAGFEDCVAAIKAERCGETMLRDAEAIPACRASEICRRGQTFSTSSSQTGPRSSRTTSRSSASDR